MTPLACTTLCFTSRIQSLGEQMPRRSKRLKRILLLGGGGAIGIVLLVLVIIYRPRLSITVQRELVGLADERVWRLIRQGAPLAEVKQAILDTGKPVDEITWLSYSVLTRAVQKRRPGLATWLLEQGADPDGLKTGSPPLYWAILNDDAEIVRILIRYGADVDLNMGDGLTPRRVAETQHAGVLEAVESAEDGKPAAESEVTDGA